MRAVVQRVSSASVRVAGQTVGDIADGFVVLLGVGADDTQDDVVYLATKIIGLRVFEDDAGKMNRDIVETGGAVLAISQFTVYGDVRRGLRPGFDGAMEPVRAEALYERFVAGVRGRGVPVATGRFRADMRVFVENDGPVTILIDSRRLF